MIVRTKDKQISFMFQETDPFFEIGCRVLEQEQPEQMLPYQRRQQDGREKIIFRAADENTVLLREALGELAEDDIIDLLYEMVYLTKKVEENGLLKKECIWYKYDNIYYDLDNRRIMTAILPIAGEFRCADGTGWYDRFEETMQKAASYLPEKTAERVRELASMLKAGTLDRDEALEELDRLGGREAERLSDNPVSGEDVSLNLLYSGRGGRLEFTVTDDDFVIGRNTGAADGIIAGEVSGAVSREHCLITRLNNKYFVQDLNSVNHTLVNGIMIPPYELMELQDNDILSVADIEFRITYTI